MANQPENLGYAEGIYQFEPTDVIEGGIGGVDNLPLKQLASRTKWLKDMLEEMNWKTGDIKEVACNSAYITANFDATGLGKDTGERIGWAICNGQNGTIDKSGRVGVGYASTTYPIGSQGGNKDAVVIAHTHTINGNILLRQSAVGGEMADYGNDIPVRPASSAGATSTSSTGESGVNKNMQPYIVTLFIQKIAS